MASDSVYVGTPKTWTAFLSAANTGQDGSGTMVDIVQGSAAPGSRIDTIRLNGVGTVADGMIRLFLNDGTNTRLFDEIKVTATIPSATTQTWSQDLTYSEGLVIPNGWTLRGATHIANNFTVIARGGNF